MSEKKSQPAKETDSAAAHRSPVQDAMERKVRVDRENTELRKNLDPTRYGDWERDGRCIDF